MNYQQRLGRWAALILCFAVGLRSFGAAATEPLGAELEGYAYPFPVQEFPIEVQRQPLKMAYMDLPAAAETANGRTIVLLHGKNFCAAYWEQPARDLSAAGFRVVMPDQIGFGKSSKPEQLQYSFQMLAGNTHQLLESLGVQRAVILGHSMGGMVATRYALMFPDSVESLVLENPIGLEDWKTVVPYQPAEAWYARELKATQESLREYQRVSYYGGEWKPEYDKWVEIPYRWTLSPDFPRIAWNSALTYDMIFTQPVVYEFPQLKVPTLLIIGQRDRTALGKDRAPEGIRATLGNYPELGRATARAIPQATLKELPGVGHLPHIEAYPAFREALMGYLTP